MSSEPLSQRINKLVDEKKKYVEGVTVCTSAAITQCHELIRRLQKVEAVWSFTVDQDEATTPDKLRARYLLILAQSKLITIQAEVVDAISQMHTAETASLALAEVWEDLGPKGTA